jgi:hypothetical protein
MDYVYSGIMDREKIVEIYIKAKEKSDDDYEKMVGYISAGTIVLSISFIEKIVPLQGAYCLWILIASWSFLATTLVTNLISHQKSSKTHQACINDWQNVELQVSEIEECIEKRNKPLEKYNTISSVSLCLGVISLIIFCSINIYTMQNPATAGEESNPSEEHLEKGRTVIPLKPTRDRDDSARNDTPSEPKPTTKPSEGSNADNK